MLGTALTTDYPTCIVLNTLGGTQYCSSHFTDMETQIIQIRLLTITHGPINYQEGAAWSTLGYRRASNLKDIYLVLQLSQITLLYLAEVFNASKLYDVF